MLGASASYVNPETPRAPFFGAQMTLNMPGWENKAIFHKQIWGQLGRQVVHHTRL
jgi:hypothetical protein